MSELPLLKVINKLAPDELHQAAWQACQTKRWYFGHGSGGGRGLSFWKMDLDGDPVIDRLWQHAKPGCEQVIGRPLKVLRQYANGHTYGLGGAVHHDDNREDTYTLLYYPMPVWENNWDGETVYQDPNGEVIAAVRPAPNRAILFDARIPHVGRAPSRFFGGLRVTIAYKLMAE